MGLFDKIIGSVNKDDAKRAMGKVADFVSDSVKELERATESVKSAQGNAKRSTYSAPQNTVNSGVFKDWSYRRSRAELLVELKDMIERNFTEYDVVYDYPAFNLNPNCHPACTPIQFMFQKNGKNVLAVVVVRQNTYRGMNVKATQHFCEGLGIPYIRFFEEYPNKEEYVVPRIKSYL